MNKINKLKCSNSFIAMHKFSEMYAKKTGTVFCQDVSVTAFVIEGLAEHKDKYGAPLCPCRHYESKEQEVANNYWNCPCIPMRERHECHCMLFLKQDNDFASKNQKVDINALLESLN